jgi:hypothetical protein
MGHLLHGPGAEAVVGGLGEREARVVRIAEAVRLADQVAAGCQHAARHGRAEGRLRHAQRTHAPRHRPAHAQLPLRALRERQLALRHSSRHSPTLQNAP